jgi:uncharacterized membrane protein YuzA (DUF378 family)
MNDYIKKKLFMIGMVLLVVGGFNWGMVALTGKDFVSSIFGRNSVIANGIFIAVGLAALGIGFFRDSYLPFLGPAVFPCSLLKEQTPEGADTEVRVLQKPGAKVMYWATEPANKDLQTISDWRKAYLSFRNAGVAEADANGYAILRVRKPQPYTVPMKGMLSPHIHYRVCMNNGFVGPVRTVTLDGQEYFENLQDGHMIQEGFLGDAVEEKDEDDELENEDDEQNDEDDELDGDEEGFANFVANQESAAPYPNPPAFSYVEPTEAVKEINRTAMFTAKESLMMESGAPDEQKKAERGADLDAAFAPPLVA